MHMLLLEKPLVVSNKVSRNFSSLEPRAAHFPLPVQSRLKMKSSLSRLHAPHFCTSVLSKQPAGLQEAPSQP